MVHTVGGPNLDVWPYPRKQQKTQTETGPEVAVQLPYTVIVSEIPNDIEGFVLTAVSPTSGVRPVTQ